MFFTIHSAHHIPSKTASPLYLVCTSIKLPTQHDMCFSSCKQSALFPHLCCVGVPIPPVALHAYEQISRLHLFHRREDRG